MLNSTGIVSSLTAFVAVEKRETATEGEMKLRKIGVEDIMNSDKRVRSGSLGVRGGFGGRGGRGAPPTSSLGVVRQSSMAPGAPPARGGGGFGGGPPRPMAVSKPMMQKKGASLESAPMPRKSLTKSSSSRSRSVSKESAKSESIPEMEMGDSFDRY